MDEFALEPLGDGISVCVNAAHRFGTDAFLLADFAQAKHKDTVCDLCAGNGIVGLLVQRNFQPKAVTGVEMQQDAAALMEQSTVVSGLKNFTPVCADLRNWKPDKQYDLVTCNPPYKVVGTGKESPAATSAAARHEFFCTFEDVSAAASRALRFGGRFCVCQRPERLCDVLAFMRKYGIEPKRLRFVMQTPESEPWLVLAEGRRGGKPFLRVEPPLYIQGKTCDTYSDEMKRIYRLESEQELRRNG